MAESSSSLGLPELPHLGTFAQAAELGSFTAAAVELGVSQAAVSQRIAALERQLKVLLFQRRAGKVHLTERGSRLYDYARQILRLHEEAREALSGLHQPVSGDLPIAASSVPGECLLPALLSAFREKFPLVHVRATVGDSRSALKEVEKGEAMLAFLGEKAKAPHLECRLLGTDSLVLVVPREHRWAGRRVPLEDLAQEPLILREQGSGSRSAVVASLERGGVALHELNVALELGSNAAIKDAVRRGLGIAFLSRMTVRRELDSREMETAEVEGLELTREFYLAYDRRRPLPPAANAFLHFLEAHPSLLDVR
ncbi:MAG: selenium metabolism-associated LysR family transcriptional regulator [Isosphaeraceae bacterium]|jgi:DNA-binding transcriptional LysR family regulator